MHNFFKVLWSILVCIKLTEQTMHVESSDQMEKFCSTFINCIDCKKASVGCDWCHDQGCTHYPNIHCSQKLILDKSYKNYTQNKERFCNEIISDKPIFVAANHRRFIKMNVKIDDLTIYKRNILCEIHIEEKILRLNATINDNILFCDMVVLSIHRSAKLGYIRLYWGGAEPYSNMILIIVYKCEYMANNCLDCQVLDKRFKCGWCQEISTCSLLEECPRSEAPWINKTSLCPADRPRNIYYGENMKPPFLE